MRLSAGGPFRHTKWATGSVPERRTMRTWETCKHISHSEVAIFELEFLQRNHH